MVNAVESITLFNRRIDKETRRDVFIPTVIEGVSYHEAQSRSSAGGASGGIICDERLNYLIRIPIGAKVQAGRQFVNDIIYKGLSDEEAGGCWTLAETSYIVLEGAMPDESDSEMVELTEEEVEKAYGGRLISVVEFADNTRRGSEAVKHWRIGGA